LPRARRRLRLRRVLRLVLLWLLRWQFRLRAVQLGMLGSQLLADRLTLLPERLDPLLLDRLPLPGVWIVVG
jgi:hypothetical protein